MFISTTLWSSLNVYTWCSWCLPCSSVFSIRCHPQSVLCIEAVCPKLGGSCIDLAEIPGSLEASQAPYSFKLAPCFTIHTPISSKLKTFSLFLIVSDCFWLGRSDQMDHRSSSQDKNLNNHISMKHFYNTFIWKCYVRLLLIDMLGRRESSEELLPFLNSLRKKEEPKQLLRGAVFVHRTDPLY